MCLLYQRKRRRRTAQLLTWRVFVCFGLQISRAYNLYLELAASIAQAQLHVAKIRRREALARYHLALAEAFDETHRCELVGRCLFEI